MTNSTNAENELLLLGLLRNQAMHGYLLMEIINRAMNTCIALKKPTAYFLLDRMTKAGWITPVDQESGGRRLKRVYQITPSGEDAYLRLLIENLSIDHSVNYAGDIGLIFSDSLPKEYVINLLQNRKNIFTAKIQEIEQAPTHSGKVQWMLEHQIRSLRAESDWIDEIIARINDQSASQ